MTDLDKVKNCLLKDWIMELDHISQSKILPVLRGCDTEDKQLKRITIMLRWLVGENFIKYDNYSNDKLIEIDEVSEIIVTEGRVESIHWFNHVCDAIKVISEKHPNSYIRYYWKEVYANITTYLSKEEDTLDIDVNVILRLIKERKDLSVKIDKLSNFLGNVNLKHLHDDSQKDQFELMKQYLNILDKRILGLGVDYSILKVIGINPLMELKDKSNER